MNAALELYRIFYAVARQENISKAADSLYISQPAVSKAIKKLEEITGVVLFSRNSRGVKLTEDGRLFYEYVERAMKEITTGENILAKLKNREQGIVKIGVSTTLCKYFLIPLLKNFMVLYPQIQIRIINKTTFDTLKLVENGEIDFGIVSHPFDCSLYDFRELHTIEDVFVASKVYIETCKIESVDDIFSKATLMLLESNNISRQYVDRYFQDNHIQVKPEIEISSMDFLIEFAKIGLGVTVVIKDFVKEELEDGSLIQIPVRPGIPGRTIGVVSHKKIPLSLAARTFLLFMEQNKRNIPSQRNI